VQALSESLLALSKHLVKRIDIIWAARQQAAYHNNHTALSRTPKADPVLVRTLQRRCFKRFTSTAPAPKIVQSTTLLQSTTKVHHPQLFVRTKIFSSYSISVATSYSRSTQNLTT